MKILLTHAYTKDNKGDAAIVSVLLRQLNNVFPRSNITVSIYDDDAKYKKFEGYKVISNSMYFSIFHFNNRLFKLVNTLYIETLLLLWALLYRLFNHSFTLVLPRCTRILAHEYLESDLFVPVGGGYLRAKKGLLENLNILLLLNPIIIGILLRKPIILYTQSIGPFDTSFQKWITRIVLNHTQLILAREDYTIVTLQTIGVKAELVVRTTDAGFLFKADKEVQLSNFIKNTEILPSKILLGITVRKWLDKVGQDDFEKAVALFVDRITEKKNINILFIPQVTSISHNDDDRDVANRIVNLVANREQVINCIGDYDHYDLKKLYSCLDFIVGTRFHSVVFSLTSYIPAIAIEYEYKTSGIMKDLGLSQWVIPIEQVTADVLCKKFTRLLGDENIYKQQLQKVLPDYILKAEEVELQIKDAYWNFQNYTKGRISLPESYEVCFKKEALSR